MENLIYFSDDKSSAYLDEKDFDTYEDFEKGIEDAEQTLEGYEFVEKESIGSKKRAIWHKID